MHVLTSGHKNMSAKFLSLLNKRGVGISIPCNSKTKLTRNLTNIIKNHIKMVIQCTNKISVIISITSFVFL